MLARSTPEREMPQKKYRIIDDDLGMLSDNDLADYTLIDE